MKSIFLAASALMLLSGAAAASDLPSKNAPVFAPAPAAITPAFSWTGFYVGGNFGGAFNSSKWSPVSGAPFVPFSTNSSGAILGGIAGYNYQVGSFVAGVEGAAAGVALRGRSQCSTSVGTTCQTRQSMLSSITGKLGFASDRFMGYVSGGVAFTHYKFSETFPIVQSWGSGNRTGWTLGLGANYAVTSNWIVGADWKYYNFGSKVGFSPVFSSNIRFRENENTFMTSVAYKF